MGDPENKRALVLHEPRLIADCAAGDCMTAVSRDRYVHLMESMPISVWATTADGSVHYANRAWREYSGFESGELVGFTDRRVIHDSDRARVAASWRAAVEEGSSLEVDCRLQRAIDCAYRWHLLRAMPETRDVANVLGWIVTATDIDESRRADELRMAMLAREQVARRQADDANRAKDDFIASVSHELRTPLHAIVGWAKVLRTGSPDAAQIERALATIERNAHVQGALIDDLLDVSRVVAGKFDIHPRTMRLSKVAHAAVEALTPSAGAKRVELRLALDEGADATLIADPDRIQQVLVNLVSNAVKFTPEGGVVTIRVGIEDGFVEMVVSDSGIGIPAEFLPYAFERFSQADSSMTRAHNGLGLGLWIARHLIELHGGSVVARSAGPNEGASFIVRFPARTHISHAPPTPTEVWVTNVVRAGRSANPLANRTIVVVDDDDDARELLCTVLERAGAKVIGCADAASAYEAVRTERPDVLVSDIGLPGEDGFALVARIRQLDPAQGGAVPAVAVSGYARSDDRAKALDSGFQAHLAKPVELAELLALLARFTEDTAI